jgi:hypothetical protein
VYSKKPSPPHPLPLSLHRKFPRKIEEEKEDDEEALN